MHVENRLRLDFLMDNGFTLVRPLSRTGFEEEQGL